MPVYKCSNGKYKIGSGKCMYDTKEKAESAYKGYLAKEHVQETKREIEISLEDLNAMDEKLKNLKRICKKVSDKNDSNE